MTADPEMAELGLYQRVLQSNPVYSQRPALAATMVGANASGQDMRTVGGFVEALDAERAVNLAQQSGARLNLTGRERSLLGSLGSRYSNVQSNTPYQPLDLGPMPTITPAGVEGDGEQAEDLNWFESAVGNVGDALGDVADFLLTNPVSEAVFDAFEWASNGVKAIYRGVSSGVNQDNDAEIRAQMVRRGYDPASTADNIAFFWNQGESIYADLSDMRAEYGDDKIDQAQDYLADPAAYTQNLLEVADKDPEEYARRIQEMETPDWQDMLERLDARHISPGRDVADGLGLDYNETGYTAVSGTLDAVATVMMDPTLMIGSGVRAARVTRDGIDSMTDANGIRRVLGIEDGVPSLQSTRRGELVAPLVAGARTIVGAGSNPVRAGAERFLSDAGQYRKAVAEGDAGLAASIHAAMTQRHRSLMPLLGEVNGRRVVLTREAADTGSDGATRVLTAVPDGQIVSQSGRGQATQWDVIDTAPIEKIEDFADYLGDSAALLRVTNGLAAGKQMLMPGRVSWAAERRARRAGSRAGSAGNTGEVFTYGKNAHTLIPDEADQFMQDMADAGAKYNQEFINASKLSLRRYRARGERLNRRLTSYLPRAGTLDMTNAKAVTEIRNLARMYLPKREADRLAMLWQSGNLAQRRNITHGLVNSTMHAAGLGRSKAGVEYMGKWTADLADQSHRRYGLGGTDLFSSEAGERALALYPKQLSDVVAIPPFAELQHMAAKGAVAGRFRSVMQSDKLDRAMNIIRMGWLVNPATGNRNWLDEASSMVASGSGRDLIRGRALHTAATKESRAASREAKMAELLDSSFAHRIPAHMRKGTDSVNDVLFGSIMGKLLASPANRGRNLTDDEIRYATELNSNELSEWADSILFSGAGAVDESGRSAGEAMARDGILAKQMTFKGYAEVEMDGGKGLNAWAQNLGAKFEPASPASIALRHITTGSNPRKAVADVESFMRSKAGERFLRDGEAVNFDKFGKRITDQAARDVAVHEYAQRLVKDVGLTVQGRNGQFHEGLVARLLDNDPPDRSWIAEHVPEDMRPTHSIQPEFVADVGSEPNKLISGYAAALAKGYEWTVTRPTNAVVRNPAFTSAYVRARGNTAQFESMLMKHGWSKEAAEEQARKVAMQHAELTVARNIDDPSVRSQMTVIIRNFSNFQRAQEDWLRRWGRNLRDDPTILRKGQLALQAGTESGVVDRDSDGNLTFSYPGSGAALTAVSRVFNLFGQDGAVQMPVVDDLSSRLTFVSPSLDNPIGFSASPIVATPFKLFAGLFPQAQVAIAATDKILNGQMGAGKNGLGEVITGFMPRMIGRIVQLTEDDPASQIASAERQAMVLLEAAGLTPDGTDPAELESFKHQLHVTSLNMMIGRALFGTFAPAAPGVPNLDVGGQEADWAFHEAGLNSLKEQYQVMVAELGVQKAAEVWAITHPNELVYAQSSATEVDADGAFAAPTLDAAKWIQSNLGFMRAYKGVSSYFIPEDPGEFSSVGWQAQLETGVRQYKSLSDFVDGIIIRRGESAYYGLKDQYDAAIAAAVDGQNIDEQAALEDEWSAVSKNMRGFNPLMAAKQASYGVGAVQAGPSREQLRSALSDPTAVAAMGRSNAQAVALLLSLQDRYEQERAAMAGDQSVAARAYGSSLRSETRSAMEQVVAQAPEMTDLYNALFRMND
ncbi:MAG: hypothetical protein M3Q75_11675 [Gemmatimonadota bacterium]|nr:hypothetical protein [Gemmatimonadota bacterium]